MKIAQVTFNFPPEIGGIGQYVWNLSRFLTKMGEGVTVIAPVEAAGLYQERLADFEVHRVRAFRFPFLDPLPLNMFSVLRELAEAQDFDIIHLHGHMYFFSFFAAVICKFLKVPYVITHHGEGLPMSSLSRIRKFLRDNTRSTYVLKHSKKVISVNRYEVKALVQRYKVPSKKIIVIPNGVDEKRFNTLPVSNSSWLEEWSDKKTILSGGVLARWKGFDYLIHAMRLVVKERDDARLLISGGGPDRVRLQTLVASLKLEEHVKFLGRLERKHILTLHSLSYMYVLPSIYDVCPTSVLEAMASGKPVIVTSQGGQRELVIDGKSGFIVQPRNTEALAKAILTLLSDEELALSMGKRSRQVVLQSFTWDKICTKVREVYANVTHSELNGN